MSQRERRQIKPRVSNNFEAEETGMWYIVKFSNEKKYGQIAEKKLEFIDEQHVLAHHLGKKYPGKIINKGKSLFLNVKFK